MPLLLTWINFIPSMDKESHPLSSVGWNNVSILLKFGNLKVISFHTLLDVWLLIHIWIKVGPYYWKRPPPQWLIALFYIVLRFLPIIRFNGPLSRYVKLRIASARGMSFSMPSRVSNPDMHRGTCVTRSPLKWVTGKTFPAFPTHAQPAFYVSICQIVKWID